MDVLPGSDGIKTVAIDDQLGFSCLVQRGSNPFVVCELELKRGVAFDNLYSVEYTFAGNKYLPLEIFFPSTGGVLNHRYISDDPGPPDWVRVRGSTQDQISVKFRMGVEEGE